MLSEKSFTESLNIISEHYNIEVDELKKIWMLNTREHVKQAKSYYLLLER